MEIGINFSTEAATDSCFTKKKLADLLKIIEKHLWRSSIVSKVAWLWACNLSKIEPFQIYFFKFLPERHPEQWRTTISV